MTTIMQLGNYMKKEEPFKDRPIPLDPKTLDFITKNVLYPDRPHMNEKEVSLENLMAHLGGTRAKIDHLSHVRLELRKKRSLS
jgi:hypothetical protein